MDFTSHTCNCKGILCMLLFSSWAVEHHEELKSIHSDLEFKLHKLKFLSLLRAGHYKEALYYSRRLSAFEGHMKGIIMTILCCNFISMIICFPTKRGSRGAARAAKSLRWSV